MKYVVIIVTVMIPLLLLPALHAQIGSSQSKLIQPNSVQITNSRSADTVYFRICGNKCSPPLDTNLKPDHYNTFTCNGTTAFSFSITTAMRDGSKVTRTETLQPTKRYEIFSDSTGVWNIKEVSR